ncbi:MAG TPA: hypothetical protein VIM99_04680 [Blastocatellia bacterium]
MRKSLLRGACAAERELADLLKRPVAEGKDSPIDLAEVENMLASAEDRITEALWRSTDLGEIETMLKSAGTELRRCEAAM